MKLIIISHPGYLEGEATLIASMLEKGLASFHIRKPAWTKEQMSRLLATIPNQLHPKLILHSHYELTQEYALKGIHWTAKHRHNNQQIELEPISTSFHEIEELQQAKRTYNYCFLSPIYDSISKQDYPSKFSKTVLQHTIRSIPQQVIALGGVTPDKIEECNELGFSGIATLGAIWQSSDPVNAFYKFQRTVKEHYV